MDETRSAETAREIRPDSAGDQLPPPIRTERLLLVPMTPEFLRASLANDLPRASRLLDAFLAPEDWPGDAGDVLEMRLRQLEADPSLLPWLLRAMVLRETRRMAGYIGFHTAPDPEYLKPWSAGAVEFGYTVFPAFRRRGFAREASKAVMRWAGETHGVTRFIMSIRPDNAASEALAAQLGFVRIGSHIDEVDGLEDILERREPTAEALSSIPPEPVATPGSSGKPAT